MPARKSGKKKSVNFKPETVRIIRDRRIGLPGYGSTLVSVEVGGPVPEGAAFDDAADAADEIACGWLKSKVDEILKELEREEGNYGLK